MTAAAAVGRGALLCVPLRPLPAVGEAVAPTSKAGEAARAARRLGEPRVQQEGLAQGPVPALAWVSALSSAIGYSAARRPQSCLPPRLLRIGRHVPGCASAAAAGAT